MGGPEQVITMYYNPFLWGFLGGLVAGCLFMVLIFIRKQDKKIQRNFDEMKKLAEESKEIVSTRKKY